MSDIAWGQALIESLNVDSAEWYALRAARWHACAYLHDLVLWGEAFLPEREQPLFESHVDGLAWTLLGSRPATKPNDVFAFVFKHLYPRWYAYIDEPADEV